MEDKKCRANCRKLGWVDITRSERKKIFDAGCLDYLLKVDEDHYEMNSKDARCLYLNEDYSCSIHNVGPRPCRCFPVHPEFKNGKKKIAGSMPVKQSFVPRGNK